MPPPDLRRRNPGRVSGLPGRLLRRTAGVGLPLLALLLGMVVLRALPAVPWDVAGFPVSTALADDGGDEGGGDDGGGDDHDGDDGGGGDGAGDDGGGDDHGGDDGGSDDGGGDDDDGGDDGDEEGEGGDDGSDAIGADAAGPPGEERRDDSGHDDDMPGEIVVINEDAVFFEEVNRLGFGIIAQQPLGALGITVTRLSLPGAMTPAAAQALLRQRYPSLLIDSNGLYRSQASLSLPAPDFARHMIGWGDPPLDCGRGIAIGLVDTGLAAGHPSFANRTIERRSFLTPADTPAPPDHGTAVAGILVGAGGDGVPPGMMPGATLRLAEAFLLDAAGRPAASAVGVAGALDWFVATGTPVVNLSIAGADNLLLAIAVRRAAARGTILVAAAGNGGAIGPPAYPAAYPDVLAVAALDRDMVPYAAGTQGDYVDFAAPGVGVAAPAAPGGLALVSGSSFASPYVAAAAAMRIASGVAATPGAIRQALAANARDLGPPGHDPVFGWGLVQAIAICEGSH